MWSSKELPVFSHPERTILSYQREALLKVTPMVQEHLFKKSVVHFIAIFKMERQQTNKRRILKNSDMSFCRCLATGGKQTAVAQITKLQNVKNAQPMLVVLY